MNEIPVTLTDLEWQQVISRLAMTDVVIAKISNQVQKQMPQQQPQRPVTGGPMRPGNSHEMPNT
jgi:hypothetical protein